MIRRFAPTKISEFFLSHTTAEHRGEDQQNRGEDNDDDDSFFNKDFARRPPHNTEYSYLLSARKKKTFVATLLRSCWLEHITMTKLTPSFSSVPVDGVPPSHSNSDPIISIAGLESDVPAAPNENESAAKMISLATPQSPADPSSSSPLPQFSLPMADSHDDISAFERKATEEATQGEAKAAAGSMARDVKAKSKVPRLSPGKKSPSCKLGVSKNESGVMAGRSARSIPISRPLKKKASLKKSPAKRKSPQKKKLNPNRDSVNLPGSAMVQENTADHAIERHLFENQTYQDSLLNDYLDKKYEECVLKVPSRLPNIQPPKLDDKFASANFLLNEQYGTLFFAGTGASGAHEPVFEPSQHVPRSSGQGELLMPLPLPHSFMDALPEADNVTNIPLQEGGDGTDEKKIHGSKSGLYPADIACEDYTPIDLSRASSEDLFRALLTPNTLSRATSDSLFKTLIGMGSKPAFKLLSAEERPAEEGEWPSHYAARERIPAAASMNTMTRVSPDPTQHIQPYSHPAETPAPRGRSLIEDVTPTDHQMPSLVCEENSFRRLGAETSLLPVAAPVYANAISPEGGAPMDIDITAAVPVVASITYQETHAGLPSENSQHAVNGRGVFHYLDDRPLHQGGHAHEVTDIAFGQQQGHFFQDVDIFDWDDRQHDHKDFGNSFYPYTHHDDDMASLHHNEHHVRAPKRVSFISTDFKLPPGVGNPATTVKTVAKKKKSTSSSGSPSKAQSKLAGKRKAKSSSEPKVTPTKKKKTSSSKSVVAVFVTQVASRAPGLQLDNPSPKTTQEKAETRGIEGKTVVKQVKKEIDKDANRERVYAEFQNQIWLQRLSEFRSFVKKNGHGIVPGGGDKKTEILSRWAKRQVRRPGCKDNLLGMYSYIIA